jgi:hypothetical protein
MGLKIMTRGGKREGAGNKYKWNHGKTKVIRVPEAISDRVLEIAKIIDDGLSLDSVTQSKSIDLSGISVKMSDKGMFVYLKDLLNAGYKIRPLAVVDRLRKDIDLGLY